MSVSCETRQLSAKYYIISQSSTRTHPNNQFNTQVNTECNHFVK